MVADEPDWQLWALWLALQLHLVLSRGARQQDREAVQRALDEFNAQTRFYELCGLADVAAPRVRDDTHFKVRAVEGPGRLVPSSTGCLMHASRLAKIVLWSREPMLIRMSRGADGRRREVFWS